MDTTFGQKSWLSPYASYSPGVWTSDSGNNAFSARPSGSTAKLGSTIGQAVQSVPSSNDFLLGMKMGYMGEQITVGPFLAYRKAKQEKRILGWQAELQDLQTKALQTAADDTMRAGHRAIASATYQAGQLKASTRASMAAAGVRVGAAGSSAEILASQDIAKEMTAAQLYANAVAQAWGYRKAAVNSNNQALAIRAARKSISPWAAAITKHLSDGMALLQSGDLISQFGRSLSGGGQTVTGGLERGSHGSVQLDSVSTLIGSSASVIGGA